MAANTNAQRKQQSNRRSNTRDRQSASSSTESSADSSMGSSGAMMSTMMSSFSTGQAMQATVDNFAKAVDELTLGNATQAVAQVQETIEHATMTAMHAKETYDLAKTAYESVRSTAKDIYAQAKRNPEPFIAAAVPAVVGLYMIFRRAQGGSAGAAKRNRQRSVAPMANA